MNKALFAMLLVLALAIFGFGLITFTLMCLAALTLALLIAIPCYWLHDMRRRNKPSSILE